MFFVIEVDNDGFKVYDSDGNVIDPAKDASVTALGTLLTAIKDTDGIVKIKTPVIVDALSPKVLENAMVLESILKELQRIRVLMEMLTDEKVDEHDSENED